MPFRPFVAILTLAAAALGIAWPDSHRSPPDRPHARRSDLVAVRVPVSPGNVPDVLSAAASVNEAVTAYLDALETARLEQARAAAEAAAREAAAAAARQVSSAPVYHPGTTVGECTGFAVPDYIIMRESGGNPSAYNPSGAYGCAQTLLSHYSSGQCQGLDPYTIDGQRECVWRLSNGGTNLQPWSTR